MGSRLPKSPTGAVLTKPMGLEAAAYCENQAVGLFHVDLRQAHDNVIAFARKKFKLSA